ncbi:cell division protein FtsQ/DivIB [Roseovarius sp. D22-M7]|uniref:cell division protein FtsQ/DivIB n=1 Tax=Roseovarius sp. D22-M7 TaxID=3127116 RepID=UPI00301036C1
MRPVIPRADPAPSRLSYRLQRMMLTPFCRWFLRVGLPVLVVVGGIAGYLADEARRMAIVDQVAEFRRQIETRPEFMVQRMTVDGASDAVHKEIRAVFPYDLPASSFDLDLSVIRARLEGIPAVVQAAVRVRQGGILAVDVNERVPVVLWRTRGGIRLLDREGVAIATLQSRAARPGLPVMTGARADAYVPEALDLLEAAGPLNMQIRGLVRVGERRWDMVLRDGKRIMLPEADPVRALERVIVLNATHEMLERDLVAVDMRIGPRPTVRLSAYASREWQRMTGILSRAGTQ